MSFGSQRARVPRRMREPILVINAGSSRVKFSVFETGADGSLPAAHGQLLAIGSRSFQRTHRVGAAGDRLPQLGYAATYAKQFTRDKLIEHTACIHEYGEVPEWR